MKDDTQGGKTKMFLAPEPILTDVAASEEDKQLFLRHYHEVYDEEYQEQYSAYIEMDRTPEDANTLAMNDASDYAIEVAKQLIPSCRDAYFGEGAPIIEI